MTGPEDTPTGAPEQRTTEASYRARHLVQRVAVEVFGAVAVEEPIEGLGVLTRTRLDDPLAGVRAARLVSDVAAGQLREWALAARGAGRSWDDVAVALDLGADRAGLDEDGRALGEVAWEWLIEHRPPHPRERYRFEPASAVWTCTTCRARVRDTGPYAWHPDDRETGHAPGCARRAAALAAWRDATEHDEDEDALEQDQDEQDQDQDDVDGGGGWW